MRSYSDWQARIRKRLRQAREQAGLSQREAGEALGITSVAYGNFERGRSPISLEHLFRFSRVTGKPLSALLDLDSPLTEDEDQLLEHYRRSPTDMWKRLVLNTVGHLVEATSDLPADLESAGPPAPGEPERT